MRSRARWLLVGLMLSLPVGLVWAGSEQPALTREEIKEFLRTARIVSARAIGKGVTAPQRLTLTDGTLTHDAAFQVVDERKPVFQPKQGPPQFGFVDSYRYNIAAYELAEMLGLDHMTPVTVERRWRGQIGALSWWVPAKMDEGERLRRQIPPPDPEDWNRQMYRMRVFAQLVDDTDRNLGNVLITEDWKLWMIDFTRAFRLQHELRSPGDLQQCDRQLLARLRALTEDDILGRAERHLTGGEIEAVLARRDLLVAHFEKLIAERGEERVLY